MIEVQKYLKGRVPSPTMAATGLPPVCYNHPEKKADFKCFDCKQDSIINLCPQCNIQVHSLDVFRAHKVEQIVIKDRERRLSQDVNDIEKLIAVESDILQNVLIRLKYCEQDEKEMLSQLIQLQTATKKRIAEIKECETRVEKAFNYLTKVSSMLTQCSSHAEISDNTEALKDPFVPEASVQQPQSSLPDAPQQPCVPPAQEPATEAQNGPPEEHPIKLPDEIKGKEIFPVSVVGSLARNGSFWMIKTGEADLDKQRLIQAGIRAHYQAHGYGSSVEAIVGTLCATLNRLNKEFCRVRIESIASSGMVKVRFVDLGLVEDVPPSSLCQIPKEFVDIPFQALECCLLPNLDTQLPYEAKWCFKDSTFSKILMAALEGQVTDNKGHSVNHVILASCGEVPVCINTKVAKLVQEQRIAQEDRPIQPTADKPESDTAASEETPTLQTEVQLAAETEAVLDTTSITSTDGPASSVASEESGDTQANNSSLTLRAEAAEFVPLSPESTSPPGSKIPFNASLEQNNVPGIIHLPVTVDKTVSAKPEDDSCETLPNTELPVGCVDFAMYNHIISQCSMNMIPREVLSKARFLMVRSNIQRVVEAMKCSLWCYTPEMNKRLNRVFNEQQAKGGYPVFLLFAGPRSKNFCGMAQMLSLVDPNGSCPTLVKPFSFADRCTGRCTIKWVYSHDIFFSDLLTPDCGFSKWYLADCGNGAEIPNKLGQHIVHSYDSCNRFRSILQVALDSYKPRLIEQQLNNAVEPAMNDKPEESYEVLPMSQEEDWDQEIEESLKAAKTLEAESLGERPAEKEETSSCVVSEVDAPASVEAPSVSGDTSTVINDGTLHSYESNKDGVSATFSSKQKDASTVINDQEEVLLPQDSVHLETVQDQSLFSTNLSSDISNPDALEVQNTPDVTEPSSLEVQIKGSAPVIVPENNVMESANESDWESASPPRARQHEAVSTILEVESTEYNSTAIEPETNRNSPANAQQTLCETVSEGVSDVAQNVCQAWADEPTSVDGALQDDLSQTNVTQNADELTPQGVPYEPEARSSLEVVASNDNPEHVEEPPVALSGGNVLSSDDGKVADNDTECPSPSAPDVEVKTQEVNGEGDASNGCSQVQSSLGAKADSVTHGSSEELLFDFDDLPVEIGKEHYVFAQENLTGSGTFWARVYRTNEEEKCFVDAMKRMGTHIEAKNEPLDDMFIYKHCAVKGWDGYWYRALIEKTADKGKVGIRLLDLGEYWDVHQKELRVLDDEFYAAPPAQAFECSVCYENPSNKKEKSRLSRVVKKGKKVRVLVESYSEGTVGVKVLT